jgi:alpha-beta hydrolase superfamily lysophospholipase
MLGAVSIDVGSIRSDALGEDRVGFAGSPPNRLFVAVHAPHRSPARALLVVCPPILADLAAQYRREVLLGRALAALGVCVVRFQYRGSGNSEGDPSETTFETLVEDTYVAAATALAVGPAGRLALMGTRVGALVAAAAARRYPAARLIVWEPVDGAAYWREAFRARRIGGMTEHAGRPVPGAEEELDRAGWLDLLGYRVDRRLYHSLRTRTLSGELGHDPRPLLRVDRTGSGESWWFGPGPGLAEVGPAAELISAWIAREPAP